MFGGVLVVILVNLIIFGSISFIVYTIVTARNRERMAIIEKGIDLSLLVNKSDSNRWRRFSVLIGSLLIGVAIGFSVGLTISNVFYEVFHVYKVSKNSTVFSDNSGHIIFAMVFLFGGIGMIASNWLNRKLDKLGS